MHDQKVFVWVLEIPKQPAPEKILFSTTGKDRDDAENKVVAYIKSLPSLSPELFSQWVKKVEPLTPEVREGAWLLHMNATMTVQLR